MRERGYQGVSLIDVDGMKKLLNFPPAMVFMLLAEDPGVCTIPENDALGAVTQLIVRYLTGQAAAYLEFYEFMEDRVLAGVPDFVPGPGRGRGGEGPAQQVRAARGGGVERLPGEDRRADPLPPHPHRRPLRPARR